MPTKSPAGLTTDLRAAPSGTGPFAAVWDDKPHQLLYQACTEIERLNAELIEAEKSIELQRQTIHERRAAQLDPEMPILVESVLEYLESEAEVAHELAENANERIQAHGLMLLCEWQRNARWKLGR